jgi:hypothetical protein
MVVEGHLVVAGEKAGRLRHSSPRRAHREPVSDAIPIVLVARTHDPEPALALAKMESRAGLERHRHPVTQPIVWPGHEHPTFDGFDLQLDAQPVADLWRPDAAGDHHEFGVELASARLHAEFEIHAQPARLLPIAAENLHRHVQAVQGAVVRALDAFQAQPRNDVERVRVLDRQPEGLLHICPATKLSRHLHGVGEVQVAVGLKVNAVGSLDEEVSRRERKSDVQLAAVLCAKPTKRF